MKKKCELKPVHYILIFLALAISACAQKPFDDSSGHIKPLSPLAELNNKQIPQPVLLDELLPPPLESKPEELFTVVVHDLPINELLFALARDAKKNVDIAPGITGNVSLNAIDQSLPQILERLKRQTDLRYRVEADTLVISPDTPYFVQYDVPYINLSRYSENEVSIATQVASTGGGADSGDSSDSDSSNSSTKVTSNSSHIFWQTLIDNIQGILRNQDSVRNQKQVMGSEQGSGESEEQSKELPNNIIANQESGIIAIRASEKHHQQIRRYIDSVLERATRQVLIEATIVEVELNDNYQTGIDWSIAADQGRFTFTNGFENLVESITTTTMPPAALAIQGQDILASIKMLDTFGNTRVLSSPKLMVLNNQTAILKVVENFVYFTTSAQSDTGQNVVTTTFETELHTVPVGLVMTVNPQISENDQVIINARPTISRVSKFVQDPHPQLVNIESKIPQVEVREMESILKINSGDIGVIGGLMQNRTENLTEGTPGLSKMPYLDNIFGYKKRDTGKTELVVFLRPRVIKSASIKNDLNDFNKYLTNKPVKFDVPEFK